MTWTNRGSILRGQTEALSDDEDTYNHTKMQRKIHELEAEVCRFKGRFRHLEEAVRVLQQVALRFEHRERPFGRRPFDERRYEEELRGALVERHPGLYGQVAPHDVPPPRRDVAATAPPATHVRARRSTSLVLRGPPTDGDADGRPTTAPARRAEPPQGALLDLRRPEPAFGQFGERRAPTPRPAPPAPPAPVYPTAPRRPDTPRRAFTAPAMAPATWQPQPPRRSTQGARAFAGIEGVPKTHLITALAERLDHGGVRFERSTLEEVLDKCSWDEQVAWEALLKAIPERASRHFAAGVDRAAALDACPTRKTAAHVRAHALGMRMDYVLEQTRKSEAARMAAVRKEQREKQVAEEAAPAELVAPPGTPLAAPPGDPRFQGMGDGDGEAQPPAPPMAPAPVSPPRRDARAPSPVQTSPQPYAFRHPRRGAEHGTGISPADAKKKKPAARRQGIG